MQLPKLVLDFGLGLAADLLADPSAVTSEAERDNTSPSADTGAVLHRVAALARVDEVDSVLAIPAARHTEDATTWLPDWLPMKPGPGTNKRLTCSFRVELRGFEPL